MKDLRLVLPIFLLILLVLLFAGCSGVVPSPGATEDNDTAVIGQIRMPFCCLTVDEMQDTESSVNRYSGYECEDETQLWRPAPEAFVELRSFDDCKVEYSTTTDDSGYYEFTDVTPGLYILTTYCPTYEDFFVKDVIEKSAGEALDAGIPDCDSTSLAMVIEYIGDTYCHCQFICPCFNEEWSDEYKLIEEIATSDSVNMQVDIPAIIAHENFGTLCNVDNQGESIEDDLVDLVCSKLNSCCFSPGQTEENGDDDPCEDNEPPVINLVTVDGNPVSDGDTFNAVVGQPYDIEVDASDDGIIDPLLYSVELNGDTYGPTTLTSFSITPTIDDVGTHSAVLTVDDGCITVTFEVTVVVEEECIEPTANAGVDQTVNVCAGVNAEVSFTGSGTGTAPLSYSWDFDDGNTSTDQNPTHTYANPFEGSPYTVTLTVTNECGETEATDTVLITITEWDAPTADAGADIEKTVCVGTNATVDFTGDGTGVGDLTYEWDFETDGIYDSILQNPSHVYAAGTYTATLRVTDDCSSATDEVVITIDEYGNPVAQVDDACYQLGCDETEGTVTLSGSATGGKAPYRYDWDFGDGESDSDAGSTPIHNYDAGEYTVTLTVTDDCGSVSNTATATITVHDPCDLPEKLTVSSIAAAVDYYINVSFSGYSGDIGSGIYYGWCANNSLTGLPVSGQELFVYCTLDASLGLAEYWPKINWIINHRTGYTKMEVQNAIWHYINELGVSGNALALVTAAESYGDFCPSPGEKFVVLLTPEEIDDDLYQGVYLAKCNRKQPILIEVVRVDHCETTCPDPAE